MLKEEIWAKALEILQNSVSSISYDLFIKSLEPIDFKDNKFYLSTTSETAKKRIMTIHKGDIFVALTKSSEEIKDFEVLDPTEKEAYDKNKEEVTTVEQQKFPGMNTFNSKYNFDNFVVGYSY